MSRLRKTRAVASSIAGGSIVPLLIAVAAGSALTIALSPGSTPAAEALGANGVDPRTAWIHFALVVLGITTLTATIESWPGFGRGHVGRGVVDRLRPGPMDGCAQATVAALILNGLATTLVLGLLLAFDFGSPPGRFSENGEVPESTTVHEVRALAPLSLELPDDGTTKEPIPQAVGPGRPVASWRIPSDRRYTQLEFRPRIVVTEAGLRPCVLRVRFDRSEQTREFRVERNGQRISVERPVGAGSVHIERLPGSGLALAFPAEHSVAIRPIDRSHALNLAYALLMSLPTLFAAFAVGCALRRIIRRDLLAGASVGIFLFLTLTGLAPQVPALAEAARARDALGSAPLRSFLWSLSIGGGLMLFGVRPRLLRQSWFRRAT